MKVTTILVHIMPDGRRNPQEALLMTRRTKGWLAVSIVFNLVNAFGAAYAIVMREPLHAATHLALLFPGGWWMLRLASTNSTRAESDALPSSDLPDRLTNLEQSIDAVAIEVERIGEGQRFMTNALTQKDAAHVPAEQGSEPGHGRKDIA